MNTVQCRLCTSLSILTLCVAGCRAEAGESIFEASDDVPVLDRGSSDRDGPNIPSPQEDHVVTGGTPGSAGDEDGVISDALGGGGHQFFRFAGEGDVAVTDSAEDDDGNLYVTGTFQGSHVTFQGAQDVPGASLTAWRPPGATDLDAFVVSFDAQGTYRWHLLFHNGRQAEHPLMVESEHLYSVAVNGVGDVTLTGYCSVDPCGVSRGEDPRTGESLGLEGELPQGHFMARVSGRGQLVSHVTVAEAAEVVTSPSGAFVARGSFARASLTEGPGSYDLVQFAWSDGGLRVEWGVDTPFRINGMDVSPSGRVAVTGRFSRSISLMGHVIAAEGSTDGAVAVFSPSGEAEWFTSYHTVHRVSHHQPVAFTGDGGLAFGAVVMDASRTKDLSGEPVRFGDQSFALNTLANGLSAITSFVAHVNESGQLQWVHRVPSDRTVTVESLMYADSTLLVSGWASGHVYDHSVHGGTDGLVVHLDVSTGQASHLWFLGGAGNDYGRGSGEWSGSVAMFGVQRSACVHAMDFSIGGGAAEKAPEGLAAESAPHYSGFLWRKW